MLQLTSFISTVNQQQLCYGHENSDQSSANLSNAYLNGGSALNSNIPSSVDFSTHSRRVDPPPNLLATSSVPLMQRMIKSETAYSNCGPYMCGGEAHSTVGDASIASFSNDSSNQSLNDQLVDADTSTFGFLGQIPRNFSLSDLTADFSQGSGPSHSHIYSPFFPISHIAWTLVHKLRIHGFVLAVTCLLILDIPESYDKSQFLLADVENFLNSTERVEHQGEHSKLC